MTNTNKMEVGTTYWIYPYEQSPPKNKKIHVLTQGGISIISCNWNDLDNNLAWAPLHRRDAEKEAIQHAINAKLGESFLIDLELKCGV